MRMGNSTEVCVYTIGPIVSDAQGGILMCCSDDCLAIGRQHCRYVHGIVNADNVYSVRSLIEKIEETGCLDVLTRVQYVLLVCCSAYNKSHLINILSLAVGRKLQVREIHRFPFIHHTDCDTGDPDLNVIPLVSASSLLPCADLCGLRIVHFAGVLGGCVGKALGVIRREKKSGARGDQLRFESTVGVHSNENDCETEYRYFKERYDEVEDRYNELGVQMKLAEDAVAEWRASAGSAWAGIWAENWNDWLDKRDDFADFLDRKKLAELDAERIEAYGRIGRLLRDNFQCDYLRMMGCLHDRHSKMLDDLKSLRQECENVCKRLQKAKQRDRLGVSVVAPSRVKAGDHMMVQVVGAEISELQEVVRIAMDEDAENEACRRGGIRTEVSHGQVVSFELSSPKFVVEDGHQEVTWDGNAFNVRFDVSVPDSCRTGSVISKVEVSIDGISIGRILFVTNVSSDGSVECRTQSRTVAEVNRYFFISYADKDAERVTHYVEGIQLGAGCDDEHIFFARNSIGKGDDWFAKICDFIDNKADVVVLFWTENSANSENVRDEYLRALKKNVPVSPIIFSRPFPPPPKELRKLSFTDRYAYMK